MEENNKEFEAEILDLKDTQTQLEEELETMHLYSKKLDEERVVEKDQRCKLQEEILQQEKNHEAEVRLRLLLENKINMLHSINR